ncbi:MAG TPA: hypothetical protein VFN44_21040, partial [Solirubrobacteraceae bacterium]|nr:hypothetical protein [Solirubrobacteraceae bacterium]
MLVVPARLKRVALGVCRYVVVERAHQELVAVIVLAPELPCHLTKTRRSLWDPFGDAAVVVRVLGGEEAILALARAHHARCLADPELNHPISHSDLHPEHVERLAAYW